MVFIMSNKKIVYPVTVEKINEIKGDYVILHGGRNSGKSYSIKYKILSEAFKSIKDGICNQRFIYLRRYYDETKDVFASAYFSDMPITAITDGKYNTVIVYRHEIFFGNIDDEGKEIKECLIGRVCSVSFQTKYKSQVFKNYCTIVFEEFINDSYIVDEPTKLFNLCSTVFRDRKGTCYMIGNLVSRFNPYYREWELRNALSQQVNSIDTYIYNDVTIKCWLCPSSDKNKMVFGHAKRAIDGVEYETNIKPHLPGDRTEYDLLYTVVLCHGGFKYLCELLRKGLYYIWYIQPKTTEVQKGTRVITKEFDPNPLYTSRFTPLFTGESAAFSLMKAGKVCYSDNLTGTEFEHIISEYI